MARRNSTSATPVSLHLANHRRRVEPGVLAGDQAVANVEDVEQPKADRRSAALNAGKFSDDMARQDRLIDDVIRALKPEDAAQMKVGNRLQDAAIRLRH